MKRYLHFNLHRTIPPGVVNQLIDETCAIEMNSSIKDIEWINKVFSHDIVDLPFCESVPHAEGAKLISSVSDYILLRKTAYRWLLRNSDDFHKVLVRYRMGDIFQYHYCKKLTGRYFTIHHTLEVPEARSRKGMPGLIESSLERLLGPGVLEGATGIIGVTREIINYELSRVKNPKPSYCLPNGILLDNYPIIADSRSGILKILFVASAPLPWHGIDIITQAFTNSTEDFQLHMVGNLGGNKNKEDNRIIYHGQQDQKYINELACRCDVGLGAFALFRKNMKEACSLKVRQYLAQGLPVFSGHLDSGLPVKFEFYQIGELIVDKVLSYAEQCRKHDRVTIREAATPYIDKVKIMQGLVEWLDGL